GASRASSREPAGGASPATSRADRTAPLAGPTGGRAIRPGSRAGPRPGAGRPRRPREPIAQLRSPDRRPAGQSAKVVEQVLAGQRVVEGDATGQIAGPSPDLDRVANDVQAEHRCGTGGRVEEAEEEPDRRRLAGPVRSEEAEDLAFM